MRLPVAPLLPIINGLVGDKLELKNHAWTITFSFRTEGKDISLADLGRLKRNVLICVHGLMADERVWKEVSEHVEGDLSVLHVRYNSGLHISTNGKLFAQLLEKLQKRFQFHKIFLAGHSMGGLVVRSACHYAEQKKYQWASFVHTIFLIAVPNAGAMLEKIGYATSFTLRKLIGWKLGLVGHLIEQRSDGIKDLRLGSMVDEDWKENKKNFLDHFKRIPVLPIQGVQYHILIASLSKNDQSLMAKYFGDGLISRGSAVGATLIKVSHVKVFTGTGHNSLLRSKDLCLYIKDIVKRSI